MKYETHKQNSGTLILLARAAVAGGEETDCTGAAAEYGIASPPDYISLSRENNFQPPNKSEPTQAQPGTKEKLRVMKERYRAGQPLHNSHDTVCLERRNGMNFFYEIFDQQTANRKTTI